MALTRQLKVGDLVVFRKQKHSNHPGPRAINVSSAPKGEEYDYQVDKYWIVVKTSDPENITVKTRRGKLHVIDRDDSQLRRARIWERLIFARRFPRVDD